MQLIDSHEKIGRSEIGRLEEQVEEVHLGEFQGFSNQSFESLHDLALNPTWENYTRLKDRLLGSVKRPLELLLQGLAPPLEKKLPGRIETQKRVISQFRKNDFGRGGCYPYLWAAFYGKNLTRRYSPQLCIKVHPTQLFYGFALGNRIKNHSELLLQALRSNSKRFASLFSNQTWVNDVNYDGTQIRQLLGVDDLIRQLELGNGLCMMRSLTCEDVVDLGAELIREVEEGLLSVIPLFLSALGEQKRVFSGLKLAENLISPKSIDSLLSRLHLRSDSGEGKLIREVYEAALRTDPLAYPFRQVIFTGAPGTGKTMTADLLSEWIASHPENILRVQFHPSYSYEDFVGGLRPVTPALDGGYLFQFESGVFKRFCDLASRHPEQRFVMVIDEINRGNVPAIFGELMWALEYRDRPLVLPFAQNGDPISLKVPSNLFLIGTMNSADRSIAMLDFALRRRFQFIRVQPKAEALDELLGEADASIKLKAKRLFLLLNSKLSEINPDFCVGHSYFRAWPGETFSEKTLERIWDLSILPLLHEYFRSDSRVAQLGLRVLLREIEPSQRG